MNAQTSRNRWLWLAPLALAFALLGILLVLLPAQAQGTVRYVAKTGRRQWQLQQQRRALSDHCLCHRPGVG